MLLRLLRFACLKQSVSVCSAQARVGMCYGLAGERHLRRAASLPSLQRKGRLFSALFVREQSAFAENRRHNLRIALPFVIWLCLPR